MVKALKRLLGLCMPLITVVIPAFNHELFVGEALESVLNQTIRDWELIVVDDGSTDGTANVVQRYKDDRIRLLRQTNLGAHAALNRGIKDAQGTWVAFLNSDDRFRPDKLESHLHAHETNPDLEASASRVRYIDESGQPLKSYSYYALRYSSMMRKASEANTLFASLVLSNHLITTSSLFARREALLEVGGFVSLRYVHDWFMFMSLAARRKFLVIEDALTDYRRHVGNTIKEDDATGQIEDNIVLAWQISSYLAENLSERDIQEVLAELRRNPRVDFELLSLFVLWRIRCAGEISNVLALLGNKDEWLTYYCYEKIRRSKFRNFMRKFRQRIGVLGELLRWIS